MPKIPPRAPVATPPSESPSPPSLVTMFHPARAKVAPPLEKTHVPPAPAVVEQLSEGDVLKKVGERYDQLNKLWTQAEDYLRKFLVPHEVEYRFKSFVGDDPEHEHYGLLTHQSLFWGRSNDVWRLVYAVAEDTVENDISYSLWRPVLECSVADRLMLVKHFPGLKDRVFEAAAKNISKIDEAISELSGLIREMRTLS